MNVCLIYLGGIYLKLLFFPYLNEPSSHVWLLNMLAGESSYLNCLCNPRAGVCWFKAMPLALVFFRVDGVCACCFCTCCGVVNNWLQMLLWLASGGLFGGLMWSLFMELFVDTDADEPKSSPPTTILFVCVGCMELLLDEEVDSKK